MTTGPSRIDLLELDIDLRLADLWREAAGISEWSLDVVAAFMRAAYGKGYCDALTEDLPGSLCADHGYRVPGAEADRERRRLAKLGAVPTRSPARLVVALAVAAVLAVFLLYTAVAGNSTPTLTPNQIAGHTGKLAVVGVVVGPVRGDSHAAGGLRFRLKNIDGAERDRSRSSTAARIHRRSSEVGRSVVVSGSFAAGRLSATDILTKCPSKYTATTSTAQVDG